MKKILLAALMLMSFPAFAQAPEITPKVEKPKINVPPMTHTYSPDYCEFSASFPDEPYKVQECEDPEKTKCFEQVSYTQVYDLSSTVALRVVCNPSPPEIYKDYTAEVLGLTLKGMTQNNYVETINDTFREEDGYKHAGLVAQGIEGRSDKIYIAQMWIGRQSVLTLEAEMVGEPNDAGDALFSKLLENVRYTGVKISKKDGDKDEEKDEEKKEEPKKE